MPTGGRRYAKQPGCDDSIRAGWWPMDLGWQPCSRRRPAANGARSQPRLHVCSTVSYKTPHLDERRPCCLGAPFRRGHRRDPEVGAQLLLIDERRGMACVRWVHVSVVDLLPSRGNRARARGFEGVRGVLLPVTSSRHARCFGPKRRRGPARSTSRGIREPVANRHRVEDATMIYFSAADPVAKGSRIPRDFRS